MPGKILSNITGVTSILTVNDIYDDGLNPNGTLSTKTHVQKTVDRAVSSIMDELIGVRDDLQEVDARLTSIIG